MNPRKTMTRRSALHPKSLAMKRTLTAGKGAVIKKGNALRNPRKSSGTTTQRAFAALTKRGKMLKGGRIIDRPKPKARKRPKISYRRAH